MNPLMKSSFKLLEERRGSVPLQGYLSLILGPLFWLWPRSLCQKFSRNWKKRSLIWLALFSFILNSFPWILSHLSKMIWFLLFDQGCQARWQAFGPSSLALWLYWLSKPYSIIEWLGLLITWEVWNSIFSSFCMLMSFPALFVFPVHFPSLFSQK